jgi:kojibiose phosphorylase
LLLPLPDAATGLIEQFAGFFDLEDITPAELSRRLIEPTEYWGWPNGIAVATQVSKQADVVMLLWLHRGEFDDTAIRANYEYYEPRCSHNSSLSHAAHAMVACRIGDHDRAAAHFYDAATVDLLSTQHPLVGGTFIGGIHTAAAGGIYQVAVQGFGGLDFRDGSLQIDPALPATWTAIEYPVSWRGHRFRVEVTQDHVEISAAAENPAPVEIMVRGTATTVDPGTTRVVP